MHYTVPRVGDKIGRPGPLFTTHVGIYLGYQWPHGDCVAHNDKETGFVQVVPFAQFAAGHQVQLLQSAPDNQWQRSQIVQRALSLVGQKFDLVTFNCEHYANYAQTGVASSPQLGIGLGLAIAVAAAFAFSAFPKVKG